MTFLSPIKYIKFLYQLYQIDFKNSRIFISKCREIYENPNFAGMCNCKKKVEKKLGGLYIVGF
jgi:hypothetical protein